MENKPKSKIEELFEQGTPIDEALRQAVRDALLSHKQAGNPICEWRDGKVVWIPPEEIVFETTGES
ncbi:MAG TPA: hypothetical protein VGY58_20210 [Gemmataceae bacterium]|nr:hypothetical protein [Gemmataceae bacterium]